MVGAPTDACPGIETVAPDCTSTGIRLHCHTLALETNQPAPFRLRLSLMKQKKLLVILNLYS